MSDLDNAIASAYERAETDPDPEARWLYRSVADCMKEMKEGFEAAGRRLDG